MVKIGISLQGWGNGIKKLLKSLKRLKSTFKTIQTFPNKLC